MNKQVFVAVALLSACLVPSVARAQRHSGAWVSGGGGVGWTRVHCDPGCEDTKSNAGVTLFIDGGVAVSEKLLVGAQFDSWQRTFEIAGFDRSVRLNDLLATVLFYPSDSSGLFVKGGVGIAYANIKGTSSLVNPDLGAGTGVTYGVGYDIQIGKSVYLTPAVGLHHGFLGDALEVVGVPLIRNWRHDIFEFTVGLTLQ
jgi:outer membrane protein with beta-barrel domain